MAYEVPALPYAYDALEPHIDAARRWTPPPRQASHRPTSTRPTPPLEGTRSGRTRTGRGAARRTSRPRPPTSTGSGPRQRSAGHANRLACSGRIMSPDGAASLGCLADAINSAFGSFSDFQAKFKETGVNQFGSGWSCVDDGSGLAVVGTANQDNPISSATPPPCWASTNRHTRTTSSTQNKRPDYIDAWWNVVNWGEGRRGDHSAAEVRRDWPYALPYQLRHRGSGSGRPGAMPRAGAASRPSLPPDPPPAPMIGKRSAPHRCPKSPSGRGVAPNWGEMHRLTERSSRSRLASTASSRPPSSSSPESAGEAIARRVDRGWLVPKFRGVYQVGRVAARHGARDGRGARVWEGRRVEGPRVSGRDLGIPGAKR